MNKINVRVTFSYVHAIFCETVEINHPRLKKIISNSNFNFRLRIFKKTLVGGVSTVREIFYFNLHIF